MNKPNDVTVSFIETLNVFQVYSLINEWNLIYFNLNCLHLFSLSNYILRKQKWNIVMPF